jgi:hypothetical protein
MIKETIQLIEPVSGFTEREQDSKAILNTDMSGLLRYKIQRRKMREINKNSNELGTVKMEVAQMKNDLAEIKSLLHLIVSSKTENTKYTEEN